VARPGRQRDDRHVTANMAPRLFACYDEPALPRKCRLTVEGDELWSFVGNKN
jgi:hypothetical protein